MPKAVSILPHEAKAQLEVFCLQLIVITKLVKAKIARIVLLPHEAK